MISIPFRRLPTVASRYQSGWYLVLALLSGALLPIQASFNAQLARSLASVPFAADVSYLVGTIALMVVLLSGVMGRPDWSALPQAPRWSLMGGLFGTWYIASSAYFTTVLGTTLTLGFVVCGQAIAGLVVDHFGWLGVRQRRFNAPRRFAVGLLLVAIVLLVQPV